MIVMSALLAAGSASAVTVRGSCRASYYPVLNTDLLQSAVSSTIDKLTLTRPTDITRGDALFFRMKANQAAGQTATAEVSIQSVKRAFSVKSK